MPQVLIDHQHPRRRPPQRDRPLGQPVLQPRGLGVIGHLRRGGLADIHRRQPVTMPGLDLALSPLPGQPRRDAHRAHPRSRRPPHATIRSTSRASRRPASTRLTSGNVSHAGAVTRACRLKGARQHLQAPLTSLVRPGPRLTQPPDIRGHGQQAVDS